jgi:Na+-transporting methylmalonyl-CoA/oxaloacetate decarboxylase gamma subunit
VFVGIIFLIFVVWLVGKIMNANTQKVEKPIKEKPIKEEKEESLAVADATEDELSDEEVIIITATLMAYYEKNNPKCEFTVKRIKRI